MKIKLDISTDGKICRFSWEDTLPYWAGENSFYLEYDVPAVTSRHVMNFMAGILLSEHFSWDNDEDILFDELTARELDILRRHVVMNWESNPYDRVDKDRKKPVEIRARKVVDDDLPKSRIGPVLQSNGMGTESIVVSNLLLELGVTMRSFTVGNQYRSEKAWRQRLHIANRFGVLKGIENNLITTDYLDKAGYKIVPWWVLGLPLAYHYDSPAILSGTELSLHKVFYVTGKPGIYRPNTSVFSTAMLSRATGVKFSSLMMSMNTYNAVKLLHERYSDSVDYVCSCMKGFPWCQSCVKCQRMYVFLKALGVPVEKVGLSPDIKVEYNMEESRYDVASITQLYRKLRGQEYDHSIEKINTPALALTWKGAEIREILAQHFEFYDYDPEPDWLGWAEMPSRWKEWIDEDQIGRI